MHWPSGLGAKRTCPGCSDSSAMALYFNRAYTAVTAMLAVAGADDDRPFRAH